MRASSQDVMLWPIEIVEARLTGVPPDIPPLGRHLPPGVQVAGALRLRLRTVGDIGFAALAGLDRLPVYLGGSAEMASHLFELLHTRAVATVTGAPGELTQRPHVVTADPLVHEGLAPGQGLLPLAWNAFHGHNLLHEYFACPERFHFFTLTQLAPALARIEGREAEIVVVLKAATGASSRAPFGAVGGAGTGERAAAPTWSTPASSRSSARRWSISSSAWSTVSRSIRRSPNAISCPTAPGRWISRCTRSRR
jgi:type VI protein secretion system component VasA